MTHHRKRCFWLRRIQRIPTGLCCHGRAWMPRASVPPHGMSRVPGAGVIFVNGLLTAFLRRRNPAIRVFLPEGEPERTQAARELAKKLAELAVRGQGLRSGLLIGEINDAPAREHFLAQFLEAGRFR